MNPPPETQIWDLWYPHAAATGITFTRGRLNATNILLVHVPPPRLTVEVRSDDGQLLTWWNAEDGSEWRRQVEFYNHR